VSFKPSPTSNFIARGLICLCGSSLLPAIARAEAPARARTESKPAAPAVGPAPGTPAPAVPPAPAGAGMTASDRALPGDAAPGGQKAPSAAVMLEAKQRFDRGFELYDEGEYPLALIEFNRAYELVPNYRVLYNIGQVCIQLGQYANARRALQEYGEKGAHELNQERRDALARDMAMLDRRTAFLKITTNVPGAEVLVDDVSMGKTPLEPALLVDAGVHRITARLSGYLPRTSQVTLAGGDEQVLALTLDVQPEEKPTIVIRERPVEDNTQLFIIGGWVTTGVLATGAIVTGLMGASESKELKRLRDSEPGEYDDLGSRLDKSKSKAKTLLIASDVFSGAALIVGGLSLWITVTESGKPDKKAEPAVSVGYDAGQFQLRGSF
jgi:PEGA domain-containing protein